MVVNSSMKPRLKSTWLINGEVKGIMDKVKNSVTKLLRPSTNFMAHSAVLGSSSYSRQNTNSKKLMIEKLSKSGLRRCTKFGQAHSNDG